MNLYYKLILIISLLSIFGCSTKFTNINPTGKNFPSVKGQSLDNIKYSIPEDFSGDKVLFLIGFVKNTQFDIDRWTIGLDQPNTKIKTFELPATQGLFPIVFKTRLDISMRTGIPDEIWGGVITIYEDGETIQSFTGNEKSRNTRVVLIDENGKIIFFHDKGFSVNALNELRQILNA